MLQPTVPALQNQPLDRSTGMREDKAQIGKGSSGEWTPERRVRTTQHFCVKKYIQHLKQHEERNGLLLKKSQALFLSENTEGLYHINPL